METTPQLNPKLKDLADESTIKVLGPVTTPEQQKILTPEVLEFLKILHLKFETTRKELLEKRQARQILTDAGELPTFLKETESMRESSWAVAATPADLLDRRVEITGPVDRKMMINALNSGAKVFMGDFEDSLSPTWANVLNGQVNCYDAVRKTLSFQNPDGKQYKLNEKTATLIVRPRGWHLEENHILVNDRPVSASLCDFALYFFHNAQELLNRNSGPYFYLPKMESHLEARLWNNVFTFSQKFLGLPHGIIKATCLIETIFTAFEMDEILYELRDHAVGLNAGRWDYIFSIIKKFRNREEFIMPDRSQISMTVPFMRAYTELLVKTCHKRNAHAMGGMAAFIPNKKDTEVTATALSKVTEDKTREATDGFDGTWVAHPDLIPVAMKVFDEKLRDGPHQKGVLKSEINIHSTELINPKIPQGKITETGLRNNINVGLQYIASWLNGTGAAAIHNLMEDAATAEISRAELWQWIRFSAKLEDGRVINPALYSKIKTEECESLKNLEKIVEAGELLDGLVLNETFEEFLTTKAYPLLG